MSDTGPQSRFFDRQKYRCESCGETKFVPESPSDAPRSIRTGCNRCSTIRRFWISGGGPLPAHLRDDDYEPDTGHAGFQGER